MKDMRIRSISYNLFIGLMAVFFVSEMHAGNPDDQKSRFKKIIHSKWFKVGVGITAFVGGCGIIWWLKNDKSNGKKTPDNRQGFTKELLSPQRVLPVDMEEKINQKIPFHKNNFSFHIMSGRHLDHGYYNDQTPFIKEANEINAAIQATVENRENKWFLILTYDDNYRYWWATSDNPAEVYTEQHHLPGINEYTKGKEYSVEFRQIFIRK